ncbi:cell division protein ZapA [Buchnera aphidicola]|uniref:Cell division protein ZapA n=1 Tax=Buchnera aphidicola subsp. Melaphis rhois TaxID=118103 RepID=A0A4D6Y470_BUCMH|nr:cell division protein ZapA [Buchnera aphidicola]QCI23383.1 cell division protein ZapA [Buchnera aphidicola (Melaphis rhois)]
MSIQYIDIKIFGRLLKVNCPNELSKDLRNAAHYLNKRLYNLKVKTGVSNTDQLIFVTALNISYELKNEKLKIREIIERLNKIITRLKNVK